MLQHLIQLKLLNMKLQFLIFHHRDKILLITWVRTCHQQLLMIFSIYFFKEYYPEEHKEYTNPIDTKTALVKLRGLDSGTTFRLRIRSVYQGVLSQEFIDTTFTTQGTGNQILN